MVREMVDLGGPVLLRGVLEWANLRLDVYFVTFFAGAGALGVYTVAVGVSQQLWTIPFSIAVPLFSRISREGDSTGSRETARYAFRILILMSLALTAVAAIAAPILIPLAYGSRFSGAIALLLLLLPGVVAISPTRALASYFTGIGRPSEPLIAEAIGVIATTTLDWTLIPRYGASGAAIASSVAYCAFSAYLTYRFKRVSQSRWSDLLSIRRQDITSVWRRLMDLIPGRIKRFASSAGRYP
jgi:O-antigen/teichoic acid export membrane protein